MIFKKGRCVNCDAPISTGILCKQCTPSPSPINIPARKIRVSEMVEGEVGFTEEYALFEADGKLYIIGTAFVSPQRERYKTAKIKVRNGIVEVDRMTIDLDDLWNGWPEMNEETDFLAAKLV
jgi:hypothetical protein